MTTDSPEPRNRDEIERDRKSAIATGALWYLDTAGLVWRAEGPERLVADVGPLLERLDRAEAELEKWRKPCGDCFVNEEIIAGQDAELAAARERLDQQTAEIANQKHRLALASNSVACLSTDRDDARRTIQRFRDRAEQAEAELAAAQARAEAAEAKIRRLEMLKVWTMEDGIRWLYADEVFEVLLAGDAARPLPEPEQPQPEQHPAHKAFTPCGINGCNYHGSAAHWPGGERV